MTGSPPDPGSSVPAAPSRSRSPRIVTSRRLIQIYIRWSNHTSSGKINLAAPPRGSRYQHRFHDDYPPNGNPIARTCCEVNVNGGEYAIDDVKITQRGHQKFVTVKFRHDTVDRHVFINVASENPHWSADDWAWPSPF